MDIGLDGWGDEVTQRETLADAAAQIGGGVIDRWDVQPYQTIAQKRQRSDEFRQIDTLAYARHHRQRCLFQDTLGIAPGGQVVERVFAEQEEPLVNIRILGTQQGQHLHRVMRSGTLEVHAREDEGWIVGNGGGGHRGAICGGGHRPVAFVRRCACRDEQDARQSQLHTRRLRQGQVPVVRRIEGTAEDAEA